MVCGEVFVVWFMVFLVCFFFKKTKKGVSFCFLEEGRIIKNSGIVLVPRHLKMKLP